MPLPSPEYQTDTDDQNIDVQSNSVGGLQPASWWGDVVRGQLKQHPDIANNIRSTVAGVVGSGFTSDELNTLQNRAIDQSNPIDQAVLMGIQAGPPVTLNTQQWNTIDGLLKKMPKMPWAKGPVRRSRRGWPAAKSACVRGRT
jgi:hypothetical protein